MQLTYTLTARDFVDAQYAHRNRTFLSRWAWRAAAACVLLIVFLQILLVLLYPSAHTLDTSVPLALGTTAMAVVFLLLPRMSGTSQFKRQPAAHGVHTAELDDNGVFAKSPIAESRYSWDMFIDWVESKTVFLCYMSPRMFVIIPKREMKAGDVSALRSLLQRNVRHK